MGDLDSGDFVAPFNCYIFIINDLGFTRNDTLPGRIRNNNVNASTLSGDDQDFIHRYSIILFTCSAICLVLNVLVLFSIYKTTEKLSLPKTFFSLSCIIDITISLIILNVCLHKAVSLNANVFSVLIRVQTILAICVLRFKAIKNLRVNFDNTAKKCLLLMTETLIAAAFAAFTCVAFGPESNVKLLGANIISTCITITTYIIAAVVVNCFSNLSLKRQQRKSFSLFTNATSRGKHHFVAMRKLAMMSMCVGACYFIPGIVYLYHGVRMILTQKRNVKVVASLEYIEWVYVPMLLNPAISAVMYMVVHGDIVILYRKWKRSKQLSHSSTNNAEVTLAAHSRAAN